MRVVSYYIALVGGRYAGWGCTRTQARKAAGDRCAVEPRRLVLRLGLL